MGVLKSNLGLKVLIPNRKVRLGTRLKKRSIKIYHPMHSTLFVTKKILHQVFLINPHQQLNLGLKKIWLWTQSNLLSKRIFDCKQERIWMMFQLKFDFEKILCNSFQKISWFEDYINNLKEIIKLTVFEIQDTYEIASMYINIYKM